MTLHGRVLPIWTQFFLSLHGSVPQQTATRERQLCKGCRGDDEGVQYVRRDCTLCNDDIGNDALFYRAEGPRHVLSCCEVSVFVLFVVGVDGSCVDDAEAVLEVINSGTVGRFLWLDEEQVD